MNAEGILFLSEDKRLLYISEYRYMWGNYQDFMLKIQLYCDTLLDVYK